MSHSTTALTDFNIGSKTRTMLEAFAEELETFYHQMFRGILEAIDTALFNSFDFPPLPATAASGLVTFSLQTTTGVALAPTADITIPKGFRIQIPVQSSSTLNINSAPTGTVYNVVTDTVWSAGQQTVSVPVACSQVGIVGNTIASSITGIVDSLLTVQSAIYKVTNQLPFINGQEVEDLNSRKSRFARFLQSLSRGTKVAILDAALTATVTASDGSIQERVSTAFVVEPYMVDGSLPVGHVDIYIFNGTGGTSAALVASCQKIIDGYTDSNNNRISGYKAAGIIANVKAAAEQPVTFQINVALKSGFALTTDMKNQITGAIVRYVATLKPGDSLVFNRIVELVMDVTGIFNCAIIVPNGDVVALDSKHIVTVSGAPFVTIDNSLLTLTETYTL